MTSSNGSIFRVTGHLYSRSPMNSPHKGQWNGALMFSLICALSKHWWGWWVETPSHPLWRPCNDIVWTCHVSPNYLDCCIYVLLKNSKTDILHPWHQAPQRQLVPKPVTPCNLCMLIQCWPIMMTSSNGNRFRITGPLLWESTGHRRIPLKRPVTRRLILMFSLICAWTNG